MLASYGIKWKSKNVHTMMSSPLSKLTISWQEQQNGVGCWSTVWCCFGRSWWDEGMHRFHWQWRDASLHVQLLTTTVHALSDPIPSKDSHQVNQTHSFNKRVVLQTLWLNSSISASNLFMLLYSWNGKCASISQVCKSWLVSIWIMVQELRHGCSWSSLLIQSNPFVPEEYLA